MSCETETAEILRRAGYRQTPQRLMILRALRHAKGHISANQIADEVRAQFPGVDDSTVYRNLDVLRRMRLVTSTDLGSGDVMFEWSPDEPHHHLICSGCGSVQDLPHTYLENLDQAIEANLEFRANLDHFAIFGLCRACRSTEEDDDDAA